MFSSHTRTRCNLTTQFMPLFKLILENNNSKFKFTCVLMISFMVFYDFRIISYHFVWFPLVWFSFWFFGFVHLRSFLFVFALFRSLLLAFRSGLPVAFSTRRIDATRSFALKNRRPDSEVTRSGCLPDGKQNSKLVAVKFGAIADGSLGITARECRWCLVRLAN